MTDQSPASRTLPQQIGLFLGPVVALALGLGPRFGLLMEAGNPQLNAMAAVAVLMAVWWMTEAIPIYATGLIPLVAFPLLMIPPGSLVATKYGHPLIFLFLGGFLIAIAIEESGLHRRVALLIIAAMGDQPRRVVLGFMVATAGLSMWLSNTATTLMLLPIAASVLTQADRNSGDRQRKFGPALMLGLAYSASIGGVATIIGTPPNVLFKGFFEQTYPTAPEVGFFQWMVFALPFSVCMLLICWVLLTRFLYRLGSEPFLGGKDVIRSELRELGPMKSAEWRMLFIFLATAALWILREPVRGWGWAPLLGVGAGGDLPAGVKWVDDGTVAMAMAMLCFILPSGGEKPGPLLGWKSTTRLPWGILLLFGGGMALAEGMKTTGLDLYLGQRLAGTFAEFSHLGMMLATATGMTFFTELTSNLASVNMILPVLAGASDELGLNPRLLMIPATLAASCAFMLPAATPPNAIVYGSGRLRMADMIRAGIVMNLVSVGMIVLFVWVLGGVR